IIKSISYALSGTSVSLFVSSSSSSLEGVSSFPVSPLFSSSSTSSSSSVPSSPSLPSSSSSVPSSPSSSLFSLTKDNETSCSIAPKLGLFVSIVIPKTNSSSNAHTCSNWNVYVPSSAISLHVTSSPLIVSEVIYCALFPFI